MKYEIIRVIEKLRVIRRLRKEELRNTSRGIRACFSGIAFIRQIENSFVLDHRREITFMVISYICYYATTTIRNSRRCFILNAYDIIHGYGKK